MLLSALIALTIASPQTDSLAAGFRNPPASVRPHTWWHWMNGMVTKEGITADLEAMKEVGIGGAQMFTVDQNTPAGPAGYAGPLWRELTAHAVKEAHRLGIELCIHNCAGWSSSGGPWITPENAMQVIAWSEVKVFGPNHIEQVLPQPKAPQVYANIPYYKDIEVYAYKTPQGESLAKKDGPFLGRTGVIRFDNVPADTTTPEGPAIPTNGLLRLSSKMNAEGKLIWDVPEGEWTVIRMGHVPTGKDNHPAPPEGDGLEVDKMSREAMDAHWKGLMAKVIGDSGPLAGKTLNNALIDSYEVGSQNWTPKFATEFTKRRGYDPMPYLPTIAGRMVESKEKTERFLWDFRRTIADLYADNYFRYFGELCHKAGLQFSTEPYGNGGFDNIQAGGTADIPMGEFWVGGGTLETTKLASSVGHVYGRPVIGAESFTADDVRGKWLEEPYAAKALGDFVFCNGINRYIFHRYAQQPWTNLKPGMTMGPWGTHLERTQTWWTEAHEWLRYVARCQYLLQKGTFVADALYYYGEDAPADLPYGPGLTPRLPAGYDYDGCDATVLYDRATVKNGKIILPNGASYRLLILPERKTMTPRMARRIAALVSSGAMVYGPKPEGSPSLQGYPACDNEVKEIADKVWGSEFGDARKENTYGKGRVFYGLPLADVFGRLSTEPDFEYRSRTGGSKIARIHRKIGDAETYFVSNQNYKSTEVDCTFRITGRLPELWHADSGRMEAAPVYRTEGRRTVVTLRLDPAESVFVIFRRPVPARHLTSFGLAGKAPAAIKPTVITVTKARYQTADGRGTDVTEIVQRLVKEGQTEVGATNLNFGDPVVNVVKQLVVDYTVNGKPYHKVVDENGVLELAPGPAGGPIGAYWLNSDSRGNPVFTSFQAGSFTAKTASGRTFSVRVNEPAKAMDIGGPWTVHFAKGWGAPESAKFAQLISWPDSKDKGIKYFSGSARYVKEITVPDGMVGEGRSVWLDLGRVKNFATVRVNGKELAVLWKEPFAVDVSNALHSGKNTLEVKITNLWPNRLIGDEQLPQDAEWNGVTLKGWPDWLTKGTPRPKTGRYTFTTWKFWNKDSPLLESGLIGPVVLRSARPIVLRP